MIGIRLIGPGVPGASERVLTADALAFVAALEREFRGRRMEILAARAERQARLDARKRPDFLAETAAVASPIRSGLQLEFRICSIVVTVAATLIACSRT